MRKRWRPRRVWRRIMFLGLRSLLRTAGFARAHAIGTWLGEIQFRLDGDLRNSLQRDIAVALGRRADDPSVPVLLREAYRVNNAAVLEIMSMLDRRQDPALLLPRCELDGLEHLRAALAQGRGAMLLTTHMGNMALPLVQLVEMGWQVSVVYRRAKMMSADFLQAGLEQYGIQGILANNGIQAYGQILSALKQGRVVLIMLDQGSTQVRGMVQSFLGKAMPMPAGPAQLIRVSRAPVLPLVLTQARPTWRFSIEPPVPFGSGAVEADVALLSHLTEQQILRSPHFWSWHHRRWSQLPAATAPSSTGTVGDHASVHDAG